MKEFRQLIRRRFLYDEVGRESKILRLIAIIWLGVLLISLWSGTDLWRGTWRRSSEFQIFVLGTLTCIVIYWLCFAKDELVLVGDLQVTASISEKHHKKLRRLARQQDTTIGDIIEQLMDAIVNARSQTLRSSSDAQRISSQQRAISEVETE
jgi:hypothetical protein